MDLEEALSQTAGDLAIACRDCTRTFVWTAGEQAYYRERELHAPKRCPACRGARNAAIAYDTSR